MLAIQNLVKNIFMRRAEYVGIRAGSNFILCLTRLLISILPQLQFYSKQKLPALRPNQKRRDLQRASATMHFRRVIQRLPQIARRANFALNSILHGDGHLFPPVFCSQDARLPHSETKIFGASLSRASVPFGSFLFHSFG
jgi:hypothetical protein